ncbi:MAG TPA: XRE family transcriptional regulator [Bdellovibrionota bacterium]|nr:XRE family transcriptional regulator [Bdellovibrionota bacterium]
MKKSSGYELAKKLNISPSRGMEAVLKAQLITAILKEIKRQHLTHAQIAERSRLPRSAVTGILSGSLQKITIDRILRLVEAVNLTTEIKLKKAA